VIDDRADGPAAADPAVRALRPGWPRKSSHVTTKRPISDRSPTVNSRTPVVCRRSVGRIGAARGPRRGR